MRKLTSFAIALLIVSVLAPQVGKAQGSSDGAVGPVRHVFLTAPDGVQTPGMPDAAGIVQLYRDFICLSEDFSVCVPELQYSVQNLDPLDRFFDGTGDGSGVYAIFLTVGGNPAIRLQSFNPPDIDLVGRGSVYRSAVALVTLDDDETALFEGPLLIEVKLNGAVVLSGTAD